MYEVLLQGVEHIVDVIKANVFMSDITYNIFRNSRQKITGVVIDTQKELLCSWNVKSGHIKH